MLTDIPKKNCVDLKIKAKGQQNNLQPGEWSLCNLGESIKLTKGREKTRVLSEKPHCQRHLERHKISCLQTDDGPCYCQQQEKATSAIIRATTTVFFS